MLEAQIEMQRELFERQDKRDTATEAARAQLAQSQPLPKESVIHNHITQMERPTQDVSTLIQSATQNTEQRMLREMHKQFGHNGGLLTHLAGRVDNLSAAAHALANKPPPSPSSCREQGGQQDRRGLLEGAL